MSDVTAGHEDSRGGDSGDGAVGPAAVENTTTFHGAFRIHHAVRPGADLVPPGLARKDPQRPLKPRLHSFTEGEDSD